MDRLTGKVAIVTGGCGRIGRAVSSRLVAEGAKVAVADILADRAGELAGELGVSNAIGIGFDATDVDSVERLVVQTVERFGRLDILHNNHAKQDREMMPWVIEFNKYDLYSKVDVRPDVEKLRPYYEELIAEFFPDKIRW